MVNQHVEIKGWKFFAVVKFDLGPLLQGQMSITKLKSAYNLLVQQVWDGKPTCRKSWAGNLLVWSDLTLASSRVATDTGKPGKS